MAHYYDDGGNSMSTQDWDEIDRSSRELLSCFLEKVGAQEIGEMTGNCCVDLSCMLNNKPVCIEIKDRNFESTKYGDILVENLKQECTTKRIMNGQFQAALAVNVLCAKRILLTASTKKIQVGEYQWRNQVCKIVKYLYETITLR